MQFALVRLFHKWQACWKEELRHRPFQLNVKMKDQEKMESEEWNV